VRIQHPDGAPGPALVPYGQLVRGIAEMEEHLQDETPISLDPELKLIDINNLAAV
jgi:hypothetical protein